MFAGIVCEDELTLYDCKVERESTLHLITKEDLEKTVFIIVNGGSPFPLKINLFDKIVAIKKQIELSHKIPTYNQKLFFNGELLNDEKTGQKSNLNNESEIMLEQIIE